MRRTAYVLGLTWVCLSPARPASAAPPYDAIYAFGDSLTDTGREPADSPYHYQGRWSNGPLWVEHLSQRFGLSYSTNNNLAESGAQCDDTYRQVTNFVPAGDISQFLFVVWAGGNDFLQNYEKHWFDDSAWDQQIAYSVSNLSNAVLNLSAKGARFILVPNTVDLTRIPSVKAVLDAFPDFVGDYFRDKVKLFNNRLAAALNQLQTANPNVKLFQRDNFASMNYILRNAETYGFTEIEIDALSDADLSDKSFDGPGANYVFWDPIHPTSKAHALIADWFHAAVAPMRSQLSLKTGSTGLELGCEQLHLTKTYILQQTADLAAWSDSQTFICVATNQSLSITNSQPNALFRLKWTP